MVNVVTMRHMVNVSDKDIRVRAVPLDLWQRVKVLAAKRNITVRQLVIDALAACVEEPTR